ncbi:MAG: MFS transporter [Caulobacteraceae bacterium]
MTQGRRSARDLALFAAPCLGLAGIGLPLQVKLPPFYSANLGLNLSAVGVAFMVVRLFDIGLDPALGVLMDRTRLPFGRFKAWLTAGVPLLMLASVVLFFAKPGVTAVQLAIGLALAYGGWSICVVAQTSWGALLSPSYNERFAHLRLVADVQPAGPAAGADPAYRGGGPGVRRSGGRARHGPVAADPDADLHRPGRDLRRRTGPGQGRPSGADGRCAGVAARQRRRAPAAGLRLPDQPVVRHDRGPVRVLLHQGQGASTRPSPTTACSPISSAEWPAGRSGPCCPTGVNKHSALIWACLAATVGLVLLYLTPNGNEVLAFGAIVVGRPALRRAQPDLARHAGRRGRRRPAHQRRGPHRPALRPGLGHGQDRPCPGGGDHLHRPGPAGRLRPQQRPQHRTGDQRPEGLLHPAAGRAFRPRDPVPDRLSPDSQAP